MPPRTARPSVSCPAGSACTGGWCARRWTSAVPPPRKSVTRPSPTLGPWKATIDGWLAADAQVPKKQRHTARRVFQRLVEEHDAEVSESTVRRYVGSVKKRQALALPDVCVPQHHPLGEEAEVDFGQVSFFLDGEPVEGWMFVMRLSASGKGFHRVYVNQAQEVFLDGHVAAFAHFGGVPRRIRYDNLKPAVVRVMKGRGRIETDRFIAMRSHYGFESFFCLPGVKGAHEKGGVEGEVGRFRRRHMVPVPTSPPWRCWTSWWPEATSGTTSATSSPGASLWPSTSRPSGRCSWPCRTSPSRWSSHLTCRVDTKARICVRQSFYSVPVRYAGRRIDVRLGADSRAGHGRHERRRPPSSGPRQRGPGTRPRPLPGGPPHQARGPGRGQCPGGRPEGWRLHPVHQRFWDGARRKLGDQEGTRALIGVLLLHRTMDAATVICRHGAGARHRARSIPKWWPSRRGEAWPDRTTSRSSTRGLAAFDRPAPSIAHYDDLLGVG